MIRTFEVTQNEAGEGSSHDAAGTEEESVRDVELSFRNPTENHRSDGRKESHHDCLRLNEAK